MAAAREIERHKQAARKLHRRMMAELDDVDCGLSLLSFIRPSVGRDVAAFDAEMAWLRANDPSFPTHPPGDQ